MKTECYDDIRAPRWGKEECEYQTAKANRQWVYGSGKNNALMHKVLYLKLRWWVTGSGGRYLVRLSSPRIMTVTGCGRWMLLEPNHSHLCEMPRPNTVICAACEGRGRNFPKGRKHEIPLAEAKIRLGCEKKK